MAASGPNVDRIAWVWFNFVPQLFNMPAHQAGLTLARSFVPHLPEELLSREDFVGAGHELVEKVKLGRRQRDGLLADVELAAAQVQDNFADLKSHKSLGRPRNLGTAQQRSDASL